MKSSKNWKLRTERELRGWSQAKVAKALGVTTKTVMRWEQGLSIPQPYYCEQLGTLFDKTVQELGLSCNTDESKAININKLVNISEGPPC